MPTVHPAPFALTSEGTVLINAAELTMATTLPEIAAWAVKQKGPVFIGVIVTEPETKAALARLDDAFVDASARLAGGRAHKRIRP